MLRQIIGMVATAMILVVLPQVCLGYEMGRFSPSPVTAFYIVNKPGSTVELELDLIKASRKNGDFVTIRIFDPSEKQVFWKHLEIGKLADGEFGLGTVEIDGIGGDLLKPVKPVELVQQFSYEMNQPGVYQVRVVAGSRNAMVRMQLSRELPWGVSFQNGEFMPWAKQAKKLYAYIPPHTKQLTVSGYGFCVKDDKQQIQYDSSKAKSGRIKKTMAVSETDKVWTFEFPKTHRWSTRAWDMPLILCNTPEAARTIRASIVELPDGTIVAHQFQAKIYALRKQFLNPELLGDTDEIFARTRVTDAHTQAMLKDAARCSHLFNGNPSFFKRVDFVIKSQNVDPESHWAGSVDGWQKFVGKQGLAGRWDRYEKISGITTGISRNYQTILEEIVWLVNLNEPFNPYYGCKELIHRAIAAAMMDLLVINEAERFAVLDRDPYPGGTASFDLARKIFPIYRAAVKDASPKVAALWTQALGRLLDRSYPDALVSTRNQSAHYLLVMDDYAQGSKLPRYAKLARRYAQRFVAGGSPAGYQMEACGPDATYIGMTRWHEAAYYLQSHDETILQSLRNSDRFFLHTVAPEPDGTIRGGFNFSHRTASGYYRSQWGDARAMLYDILPDVALWKKPDRSIQYYQQKIRHGLNRQTQKNYRWLGMQINVTKFQESGKTPVIGGVWPALEKQNYIRNFGDELIAIKRPGYFTSIYVGKPAGKFYIRYKEKLRPFYPNDGESNGQKIGGLNHSPKTPLIGGGMSILSSPTYGSVLLATNCSPLTYHGPVVVDSQKNRYWADYHATQFKLDEKKNTLIVTGEVEKQNIAYKRIYTFKPDQLQIQVVFTATQATDNLDFFENIPIALGRFKKRGCKVRINDKESDQGMTNLIAIRDKTGNGFDLKFETTRPVKIVRNGLIEDWAGEQVQFGRIEVPLPVTMKKGEQAILTYHYIPVIAH